MVDFCNRYVELRKHGADLQHPVAQNPVRDHMVISFTPRRLIRGAGVSQPTAWFHALVFAGAGVLKRTLLSDRELPSAASEIGKSCPPTACLSPASGAEQSATITRCFDVSMLSLHSTAVCISSAVRARRSVMVVSFAAAVWGPNSSILCVFFCRLSSRYKTA